MVNARGIRHPAGAAAGPHRLPIGRRERPAHQPGGCRAGGGTDAARQRRTAAEPGNRGVKAIAAAPADGDAGRGIAAAHRRNPAYRHAAAGGSVAADGCAPTYGDAAPGGSVAADVRGPAYRYAAAYVRAETGVIGRDAQH